MPSETVKTLGMFTSVKIRKWDHDNQGYDYDWITDAGGESDMLFKTLEEAEEDARSNFGG